MSTVVAVCALTVNPQRTVALKLLIPTSCRFLSFSLPLGAVAVTITVAVPSALHHLRPLLRPQPPSASEFLLPTR